LYIFTAVFAAIPVEVFAIVAAFVAVVVFVALLDSLRCAVWGAVAQGTAA
jgi:hypothetical protein